MLTGCGPHGGRVTRLSPPYPRHSSYSSFNATEEPPCAKAMSSTRKFPSSFEEPWFPTLPRIYYCLYMYRLDPVINLLNSPKPIPDFGSAWSISPWGQPFPQLHSHTLVIPQTTGGVATNQSAAPGTHPDNKSDLGAGCAVVTAVARCRLWFFLSIMH